MDETMKPSRVQRRRTKGWRMPENAVYVGRPSKYGNEYDYKTLGREVAVARFRHDMERHMDANTFMAKNIRLLRGKHLVCWCPLHALCHADVLLELANKEPSDG